MKLTAAFLYSSCLLLVGPRAYGISYYDGVEKSPFYGQLYVGSASSTFKLEGTSGYNDSGTGFGVGFQGDLRIFRRFHLAGLIEYYSPVVSSATNSFVSRFEQNFIYDLSRSLQSTIKMGFGWNLNYLDSGPRQYGYQALAGLHGFLSLRFLALSLYGKYGPAFNSGTTSMSNSYSVYGSQLALSGPDFAPSWSVYFEVQSVAFTSKITGNSSQSSNTVIGMTLGL